jgi:hypothetical protein
MCVTTMSPHDVVLAPAVNDDTHWLPVTLQHLAQNLTDIQSSHYISGPLQVKTLKLPTVLASVTAPDSRVSLGARQHVARFLPKYQD